jgi:hypothetical protein
VKSNFIEVPDEFKTKHQDQTVCVDIMYVNGMPMLTGIDRTIRFRALIALDDRSADEILKASSRFADCTPRYKADTL